MSRFATYYTRFQGAKGGLNSIPTWGRIPIAIAMLPGLILAGLSILAFVVSLLALFLLTVPVYRLVRWITAGRARPSEAKSGVVTIIDPSDADYGPAGRRKPVEGTIVDQ